jgi:hypothetical protein
MTYPSATAKLHDWFSRPTFVFPLLGRRPRRELLDVRRLSDHLKRDMGFLDGVDPTGKGP